jgi:hypothetical protein
MVADFGTFFGKITGVLVVFGTIIQFMKNWKEILINVLEVWLDILKTIDELPLWDLSAGIARVEARIARLGGDVDITLTKFEQWQEIIDNMETSEIADDLLTIMNEWQRFDVGDHLSDIQGIVDEYYFARMEIEKLMELEPDWFKEGGVMAEAMDNLIELTKNKIEEIYEALYDAIDNAWRTIKENIADINMDILQIEMGLEDTATGQLKFIAQLEKAYDRLIANVQSRMDTAWMGLGAGPSGEYHEGLDPEQYIAGIEEVMDLVVERYELEKQKIMEVYQLQIQAQEDIKAAYQSLADEVEGYLNEIATTGLSQGDAMEQYAAQGAIVAGLESQIAGFTGPPEELAALYSELASALMEYLSLGETALTRPSLEYGELLEMVTDRLEEIQGMALTQAQTADEQIIALETAMLGELQALKINTTEQLNYLAGLLEDAKVHLKAEQEAIMDSIDQNTYWTAQGAKEIMGSTAGTEQAVKALKDPMVSGFGYVFNQLVTMTASIVNAIANIRPVYNFISNIFSAPSAPSGEKVEDEGRFGIPYVPKTGKYLLHQGEMVVPKDRSHGGETQINFNVELNAEGGNVEGVEKALSEFEENILYGEISMKLKDMIREVQ